MNVSIIAGGAGFIGCNLLPVLAKEGRHLMVLDNLCRGDVSFLNQARLIYPDRIHFLNTELSHMEATHHAFKTTARLGFIDEVWHLAANSDIAAGVLDSSIDMRDTLLTTFSLLQAMSTHKVRTIHFASSSAVYGDMGNMTLHESIGPLLPISNYGAMKLSSEAIISAAAESYLDRANIFRFPNVVGAPATHGVILDFIKKLKVNSSRLDVLGDGTQQKVYLHVSDLVAAMMHVRSLSTASKVFPINIGPGDDGVTVRFIAESVRNRVNPSATIYYGAGNKGWLGDVPKFKYSVELLYETGWSTSMNSNDSVSLAIEEIARQEGL